MQYDANSQSYPFSQYNSPDKEFILWPFNPFTNYLTRIWHGHEIDDRLDLTRCMKPGSHLKGCVQEARK